MSTASNFESVHLRSGSIPHSDLSELLVKVQTLREELVTAWRDRGVTLTSNEQERFHAEILDTCRLLTDLTLTR